MQQYYVDMKIASNEVEFTKEQQHHIRNVMRKQTSDEVYVVDSENQKYLVSLNVEKEVSGTVVRPIASQSEIGVRVGIAQGLIKGDRWDYFLQKSVEFGTSEIIPLSLKRNVVKVDKSDDKKHQRWSKIILEAAEQSKRDIRPSLQRVSSLKELVNLDYDLKLIAYENEAGNKGLREYLSSSFESVLLVVGAEGGLASEEVEYLEEHGFKRVGLGGRILRAESASLYFLSALSYEKELK